MSEEIFYFISDDEFRNTLESDYREMKLCFEQEAFKGSLVLAGSIIEAIMTDYLLSIESNEPERNKILKLDLWQIINKCFDQNIISQKTKNLSDVIRDYRNLIHPGKSIRTKEKPTKSDAQIASALVELIISEISKKKQETYGFTAEQIMQKIENDTTSIGIWHYFINKLNPYEKEKLLLGKLHERFFEIFYSISSTTYQLNLLSRFFNQIYLSTDSELHKKVAENFLKIINEGDETEVIQNIYYFFDVDYFSYFSEEEAEMVVQYIINQVESNLNIELVNSISGFMMLLDGLILKRFLKPFIHQIVYKPRTDFTDKLEKYLYDDYINLTFEKKQTILEELDVNKMHFASNSKIKENYIALKDYLEDILPF